MAIYYLGFESPYDGANRRGGYERFQRERYVSGIVTVSALLSANGVLPPLPHPRVRFTVDGAPVTDWMIGARFEFPLDTAALAPGHHCLHAEWEWSTHEVWVSGVLFHTGAPIPLDQPQTLWACPAIVDHIWAGITSDRPIALRWTGTRPARVAHPASPRAATPYATVPHVGYLWATRLGSCAKGSGLMREPVLCSARDGLGNGRLGTGKRQMYAYFDLASDIIPLRDGRRGEEMGTMGHAWKLRVAGNGSIYWIASNGRLGWTGLNGRVVTVAGRRLKPGAIQPYWGDIGSDEPTPTTESRAFYDAQHEWHADWRNGAGPWREPWGMDILDYVDGGGSHIFAVVDTVNHGLDHVDHYPAHEPGGRPVITRRHTFASATDPWDCAVGPDGRVYTTLMLAHQIVAVDDQGAAEVVFSAAHAPTPTHAGVPERYDAQGRPVPNRLAVLESPSGFTPDVLRARYNRDGGPGVGSLVFPQAIVWSAARGEFLIACRFTFSIHAFNPVTRQVRQVAVWPTYFTRMRDVSLAVSDGTTGPAGLLFVTAWYSQTDWILEDDGSGAGRVHGPIVPLGNMSDMQAVEGPANRIADVQYPTGVAAGRGRLFIVGTGATQQCWMLTRREPSDPPFDVDRYRRGRGVYNRGGATGGPRRPSFALSHGDEMQGGFGLLSAVALAPLSDAELSASIHAGMGTGIPRPEISGQELSDLIYFIRWNGQSAGVSTRDYAVAGAITTVMQ